MTYIRLAFVLIVVIMTSGIPTPGSAESSCSEWRGSCKNSLRSGKDPKMCDAAFTKCMQSGRWFGPDTGRDYGPAAKR
jgi:hypothetical protein